MSYCGVLLVEARACCLPGPGLLSGALRAGWTWVGGSRGGGAPPCPVFAYPVLAYFSLVPLLACPAREFLQSRALLFRVQ